MPSNYFDLLKTREWGEKRQQIITRDGGRCTACGERNQGLQVHHIWYTHGRPPWDVPDSSLRTLCEACHTEEEVSLKQSFKEIVRGFRKLGLGANEMRHLSQAVRSAEPIQDELDLAPMFDFLTNKDFRKQVMDLYCESLRTEK